MFFFTRDSFLAARPVAFLRISLPTLLLSLPPSLALGAPLASPFARLIATRARSLTASSLLAPRFTSLLARRPFFPLPAALTTPTALPSRRCIFARFLARFTLPRLFPSHGFPMLGTLFRFRRCRLFLRRRRRQPKFSRQRVPIHSFFLWQNYVRSRRFPLDRFGRRWLLKNFLFALLDLGRNFRANFAGQFIPF
jgi:hypothetical protein